MQGLPKDIEYRLVQRDREIKGPHGEHKGWERVQEIHRIVTKNDSGTRITTSDTVISDTPEEFREKYPGVPLIGAQHEVRADDVRKFLDNATPEELADLGLDPGAEPDVPQVTESFPVHDGGPYWTLSDGSRFRGKREDAEAAQRALEEGEVEVEDEGGTEDED